LTKRETGSKQRTRSDFFLSIKKRNIPINQQVPLAQQAGELFVQPSSLQSHCPVGGGPDPTTPGILSAFALLITKSLMAKVQPFLG
jgi:hypothetical protein